MTEESHPHTIIIAGRALGFAEPTKGQLESMVRIARLLNRGGDDEPQEFWEKQVDRVGTLIEAMITEGDRDTLDMLMLTGKTDSAEVMTAILTKVKEIYKARNPDEAARQDKAAKANVARVRRK